MALSKMLVTVLFASFVMLAVSSPSQRPTGPQQHGHDGHGPHGPPPCGHHPHGPPRCDKDKPEGFKGKHGGDKEGHHGPPHPHGTPGPNPLGPLAHVYCNLTTEQQEQVNKIVETGFNSTKKELRTQLDTVISGLSSELQEAIAADKKHFEEMREKIAEKIKTLSSDAQQLSTQIEAILKDDSISFPEEGKKLHELVEKADKKVVKEFLDAHIPIPGLCGPPPKPHGGDKRHHKH